LAKKHEGKIKVCMINIVGGGSGEEKFASSAGLEKCSRFVCLEPNPLFAVNSIPHVTGCRSHPLVILPLVPRIILNVLPVAKGSKSLGALLRVLRKLTATPTFAVIHRGGMVVRNGTAPDLETLLEAMAAEPLEE